MNKIFNSTLTFFKYTLYKRYNDVPSSLRTNLYKSEQSLVYYKVIIKNSIIIHYYSYHSTNIWVLFVNCS